MTPRAPSSVAAPPAPSQPEGAPTDPAPAASGEAEPASAHPSWQETLAGGATYRVLGRMRSSPDVPWSALEWTVAQEPMTRRGERLVAAARILRVRCQSSSLLDVNWDSDHPTSPPPIGHLDDLVAAALAAPLELEFDARTCELLEVRGLPLGNWSPAPWFTTADGRGRVSVSYALRPLARWFSAEWGRALLHGAIVPLPRSGAGPSFRSSCWWTAELFFELPARLHADEGGRFVAALDGPARMFRTSAGRTEEVRVADVHYEGTVEVKDGAIVRARTSLRFTDLGGKKPIEARGDVDYELQPVEARSEVEFELLRRGG